MSTMPHVRMPTGAPTMWPPPPPPPPCHAPPVVPTRPLATQDAEEFETVPIAQDLLAAACQRANMMLATAIRASELQVNTEIRKLEVGFVALKEKVAKVEALLNTHDPTTRQGHKDTLSKVLSEVEQRWERDVKDVKRELHQTILAHNHNADLMADHKNAIDNIHALVESQGPPLQQECGQQLHEQLERLTWTLEQSSARDQDIDTLLRRGEALLQHVSALGHVPRSPMGISPASLPPNYRAGQAYQHSFTNLVI